MTVDDAAAILDVTEGHVKDLIREGNLIGAYAHPDGTWTGHPSLPLYRLRVIRRGEWWVDGASVRARKRALGRQRRGG